MASTDARPLPIKNTAYRLTFPIYKSDGTLITAAAGLDSEVSKDAGTFADCTSEATEIATSSGVYYLDLTSTEMNADCVAVVVKTSSTGAVPPVFILYPQESGDVKVDVQSYGGTAGTFASGRPEVNTTHAAGTAWGSGAITAASLAADAITAAKVADDVSTEFRTKALALTTASGVVGSGSTTANVVASSVAVGATTSLSADAWKGRVIIFNSDTTTAALRGQAAAIVSHTSGSTPTFTLATGAWTTAPLTSDTFTVV